jgi:hypothetical protein
MSSDKGSFKVTDRRHFTPEGQARPTDSDAPGELPGDRDDRGARETPPPVEFGGFLLGLAAQASVLLREGATEGEGDLPAPDPVGARQIISILEMLQDKTEGRRTAEESKLLDSILFELRMAYVARTKGGAR